MIQFPPYITTEQKNEINKIVQHVKQTQGLNQAIYTKKLFIVAMYGVTIMGKIEIDTFIDAVKRYLHNHSIPNNSIYKFWDLKNPYNPHTYKLRLFLLNTDIMWNTPLYHLPIVMQNILKEQLKKHNIKTKYIEYVEI